jgi:hypothetical protein
MKTNTKTQDILKFQREMEWVIQVAGFGGVGEGFFYQSEHSTSDLDGAHGFRYKREAEAITEGTDFGMKWGGTYQIARRKTFRDEQS